MLSGVLVFEDVFADVKFTRVSFVDVSIVDVLVAKVVVDRTLRQISSDARSSSAYGGLERVHFFASLTWWRLRRAVLTGERSGELSAAVHYRRAGTVSLAARWGIMAVFRWGGVDIVWIKSLQVLASTL